MPDLGTLVSNAERYMLEHDYAMGTIEHCRRGWRKLATRCEELEVEGFDDGSERRVIQELGLDRERLDATQRTQLRSTSWPFFSPIGHGLQHLARHITN